MCSTSLWIARGLRACVLDRNEVRRSTSRPTHPSLFATQLLNSAAHFTFSAVVALGLQGLFQNRQHLRVANVAEGSGDVAASVSIGFLGQHLGDLRGRL